MRIGWLTVPGRFPTTVHDPGVWWDALRAAGYELFAINLNARWWWQALAQSAGANALRSGAAFGDADAYRDAIADLDRTVAAVNRRWRDVTLDYAEGPRAAGVDLADSASIAAGAAAPGVLADSIAALLAELPRLDLVLLRATSPAEIATAATTARLLRALQPAIHVCLADHSYENFSLRHHLPAIEATGALLPMFDTVVAEADDIPVLLPLLAGRLAAGDRPRGVLRNRDIRASRPPPTHADPLALAGLLEPLFAPEPVLHLRLSAAACYWGRCTFCTQNSKYAASPAARKQEVTAALDRIEAYVAAGCRTIVFTDEAISPAMLGALADAILARGLHFRWAGRCKLERSYEAELLARCAQAGCRELLFGLESIVPSVLAAMDKSVPGQDAAEVAAIFHRIADAGIGLHVNLINGFPGEGVDEAWETARFVGETLASRRNVSFGLNPFTVFPATPIAAVPERFGIGALHADGDMPASMAHELMPATRRRTAPSVAAFHRLQADMETRLGWSGLLQRPGGRSAFQFYSSTGHGVLFKAGTTNPVDAARGVASVPPASVRRRWAFLTGATGVVGGAVLAELRRGGWRVTSLVRDPFAGAGLADEQVLGDLFDLPPLGDLIAGVDAIFHCASPRSLDRAIMQRGEIDATARLLDAWSSGSFVYCSSQTVYGVADGVLDESSPLAPESWYDLAKARCEEQVAAAAMSMDAPAAALRLPLVFSDVATPGRGNWLIELADAMVRGDPFVFASHGARARDGSVWIGADDAARAIVAATRLEGMRSYPVASGFVTWADLLHGLGEALGQTPSMTVVTDAPAGGFRMPRSRTRYDGACFEQRSGFSPRDNLPAILAGFARAHADDIATGATATGVQMTQCIPFCR